MDEITNTSDVIDSRDVIERIAELEANADQLDGDEEHELDSLLALTRECADYTEEWTDGAQLIRGSYFTQYAEELADEIGAINTRQDWPLRHIDWEAAADELKADYTEINFDGAAYWLR